MDPRTRFKITIHPDGKPTMLDPAREEHDQFMEISTLLLPWWRDRHYGDCTSNLSLTGKIAHFELAPGVGR